MTQTATGVLAIDIGGTKIALAAISATGEWRAQDKFIIAGAVDLRRHRGQYHRRGRRGPLEVGPDHPGLGPGEPAGEPTDGLPRGTRLD
ncbi:hypothetical protein [Levilactobacillus namurensis]|uniref:hypothetical protein n=1 Tax=Levilactobacillus namurensis TaxID=380393 RepID=UPI001CDB9848|nr:hypothetical protein [Levilactobacillus namurensis]